MNPDDLCPHGKDRAARKRDGCAGCDEMSREMAALGARDTARRELVISVAREILPSMVCASETTMSGATLKGCAEDAIRYAESFVAAAEKYRAEGRVS